MQVGRNDPCPCGSGKKYKKCCLNNGAGNKSGESLSPTQLVKARARAFAENDFAFIYDTFHPDSNFRLQFPNRSQYISYGLTTLTDDYLIKECRVLNEVVDGAVAQVLFYLKVHYQGKDEEYFELSEFQPVDSCWRYLQSHKLSRSEFKGNIDEITCDDVATAGICF
ncbi:MAG: hypothetical protein B6I36_00395 [Desulfobacteraceae bacterium 4572_35.1]|nr:MAG: hypothetical protein B6I36_00395 [Desulfobacteraceae bacterium 4572_35.1]